MKYKCLVLDHDDTVVSSTVEIHWPAFLEALRIMRPGETISAEDYFKYNFDPGFLEFCVDKYKMTEEELKEEELIWKKYVSTRVPSVYPGMKEVIEKEKAEGGLIVVSSHSFDFNIRRDYKENDLPEPDEIFGWELPNARRKPDPYALEVICEKYALKKSDIAVIDDLKPGYDMARAFGVTFIGAGWCNNVPEIRAFMQANSDVYFDDTKKLFEYLF